MLLTDAIEQYKSNLKKLGRSQSTITAYSKDLDQLQEFLDNPRLKQIGTQGLESFIESLAAKGLTNKTISRKLNSIKSFFRFLSDQGRLKADPSEPLTHPEIKQKLPNILSEAQYNALRQTAQNNERMYAIIELMLQTGMRIGEISRLKVADLDLNTDPGQILIQKYSSSPMRLIELNPKASKAMEDYLKFREQQAEEVDEDEGYVFMTKHGGHIIVRNLRASLNRILKKANLTGNTVNDLRNTFIAAQLEKGVSLAKVAQTVGHKRFSSTEKYLPLIERKNPGNGERIAVV